jgi:hypothetical protein
VLPRVLLRHGNINPFPFRRLRLGCVLGSANSSLTAYCEENLALSADQVLIDLSFYYYQDLFWGPVHGKSPSHFDPTLTLSYRITLSTECAPGYRDLT